MQSYQRFLVFMITALAIGIDTLDVHGQPDAEKVITKKDPKDGKYDGSGKKADAEKKDLIKDKPGINKNDKNDKDIDPLAQASDRLKAIERRGVDLDKTLTALGDAIAKLPGGPGGDKKTREQFLRFLIDYELQMKEIAALEPDVRLLGPALKKELAAAPEEYEAVAAEMDRKAKTEPNPEHQAHFAALGKDARNIAVNYRRQAETADAKIQQVLHGIAHLQANARVAKAMRQMLEITPNPEKLAFLDRFLGVIEQSNRQMNDSIRDWRGFWDRQRFGPTPAAIPGQPMDSGFPPGVFPPGVFPGADPNPPAKK